MHMKTPEYDDLQAVKKKVWEDFDEINGMVDKILRPRALIKLKGKYKLTDEIVDG